MKPRVPSSNNGIGATEELRLRISVATLVRVLFQHPDHKELILALERRATLGAGEEEGSVDVKAQPFGGALRIHDAVPLQNLIGDFHFDSEVSRSEQDFRLFIRPSAWENLRKFCFQQFSDDKEGVLELDPTRELTEEFVDALNVNLKAEQYGVQAIGTIVEEHPSPTENIHARGHPTARIYRIFEARILDPSLAFALIKNSENCSDQDLHELAWQASRNGNSGRANAVLTLPFQEITAFYLATPPHLRNTPIWFHGHQLDETVAAILEDVAVPKYQRRS